MQAVNLNRCVHCLIVIAASISLATSTRANDDTARFYGTWKATTMVNGQSVTVISMHDASGYKNYIQTPNGDVPAGAGTFAAVNGKWSSNTAYPTTAAFITS